MKTSIKLDKYDKSILYELDQDARQPLSGLAKKVKLSRDAIRNRINKLIKNKIITGFKPIYQSSGMISYLFLSFQDPFDEKKFLQHLKPNKYITNIGRLIGKWDFLLQIITKDQTETDQILKEIRKKFPVKDQEVYSVLEQHKNEVGYIENLYK